MTFTFFQQFTYAQKKEPSLASAPSVSSESSLNIRHSSDSSSRSNDWISSEEESYDERESYYSIGVTVSVENSDIEDDEYSEVSFEVRDDHIFNYGNVIGISSRDKETNGPKLKNQGENRDGILKATNHNEISSVVTKNSKQVSFSSECDKKYVTKNATSKAFKVCHTENMNWLCNSEKRSIYNEHCNCSDDDSSFLTHSQDSKKAAQEKRDTSFCSSFFACSENNNDYFVEEPVQDPQGINEHKEKLNIEITVAETFDNAKRKKYEKFLKHASVNLKNKLQQNKIDCYSNVELENKAQRKLNSSIQTADKKSNVIDEYDGKDCNKCSSEDNGSVRRLMRNVMKELSIFHSVLSSKEPNLPIDEEFNIGSCNEGDNSKNEKKHRLKNIGNHGDVKNDSIFCNGKTTLDYIAAIEESSYDSKSLTSIESSYIRPLKSEFNPTTIAKSVSKVFGIPDIIECLTRDNTKAKLSTKNCDDQSHGSLKSDTSIEETTSELRSHMSLTLASLEATESRFAALSDKFSKSHSKSDSKRGSFSVTSTNANDIVKSTTNGQSQEQSNDQTLIEYKKSEGKDIIFDIDDIIYDSSYDLEEAYNTLRDIKAIEAMKKAKASIIKEEDKQESDESKEVNNELPDDKKKQANCMANVVVISNPIEGMIELKIASFGSDRPGGRTFNNSSELDEHSFDSADASFERANSNDNNTNDNMHDLDFLEKNATYIQDDSEVEISSSSGGGSGIDESELEQLYIHLNEKSKITTTSSMRNSDGEKHVRKVQAVANHLDMTLKALEDAEALMLTISASMCHT